MKTSTKLIRKNLIFLLFFCAITFAQTIDYIEVESLPVYDTDEDYWGPYDYRWAYKIANSLHISSKQATLRRFLPFTEGDSLAPELIEEAQRRLRSTDFIGEAQIELIETDSGNVALVRVRDLWTTKLSPTFSYRGRVIEWSVEAEEVNLIGYGINIAGSFRHDEDYNSWYGKLSLPKILPGQTNIRISHSNATETIGPRGTALSITKKRKRDSDKLIIEAGAACTGGIIQTYSDDNKSEEKFRIDDQKFESGIEFIHLKKYGFGFGLSSIRSERILEENSQLYFDNDLEVATLGFSYLDRNYYTTTDVDAFGRTEDIFEGYRISIESGIGPESESPYHYAGLALSQKIGFFHPTVSVWYKRLNKIEYYSASMRFFTDKVLWSRICGRFFWARVSNAAPDVYYRVGGQSYLRTYRSYKQVGENILCCNLESRTFTSLEIASIRFGAVLFADFATAWDNPHGYYPMDDSRKPIIGDYGIEIRLASTSSTTGQILRLSLARSLDGELWQFELASGQLFRSILNFDHRVPLP